MGFNGFDAFFHMGIFIYSNGDDIGMNTLVKFGAGCEGCAIFYIFMPLFQIFGIFICCCYEADLFILFLGHGVRCWLLSFFIKAKCKTDSSDTDYCCCVNHLFIPVPAVRFAYLFNLSSAFGQLAILLGKIERLLFLFIPVPFVRN